MEVLISLKVEFNEMHGVHINTDLKQLREFSFKISRKIRNKLWVWQEKQKRMLKIKSSQDTVQKVEHNVRTAVKEKLTGNFLQLRKVDTIEEIAESEISSENPKAFASEIENIDLEPTKEDIKLFRAFEKSALS